MQFRFELAQIQEFEPEDLEKIYPISDRFQYRNAVGGTMFAGGKEALLKFRKIYADLIAEADSQGIFKGKDQSLYAFCVLRYPDLFNMIQPVQDNYDVWFCLHHLWSGVGCGA